MRSRIPGVALLALCALALPQALRVSDRLDPAAATEGTEAARVERVLAERFGSPFARHAILVVEGLDSATSAAGRATVREVVSAVSSLPFVIATVSPASALDTLLLGGGARGALVVVGIDAGVDAAEAVAALRATTSGLRPAGVTALRWTGMAALEADLQEAGAREARRGEMRALPVSLALAVWAFAGLRGALAGLLAGALTLVLALAATATAGQWLPLSVIAPSVATLIGLALGIDYALVLRRREAGAEGTRAARHTVVLAGAAAAAGFAPLALVDVPEIRSAGVAALLAAAAALVVALVLDPLLPSSGATEQRHDRTARWRAWARRIVRRPGLALAAGLLPIIALGGATRLTRPAAYGSDLLPRSIESARAMESLEAMSRLETALGLRVILELPAGHDILATPGWAALARFERGLLQDPRIAAVRSIHDAAGGVSPAVVRRVFPAEALRSFMSHDGRAALLQVTPRANLDGDELGRLVRDVRAAAPRSGIPGSAVLVGGVPAAGVDFAAAVSDGMRRTIALSVAAALALLLIALRSVLMSVKAVLLNLLSTAAALGATTLVFQEGAGARLLGLETPLDGIVPSVPLLAFCAVFALGMDYEIFLLSAVARERRRGAGDEDAIVDGLMRSAGVITRSAAIMTGVFAAFALSEFVLVKMVGFALAVAIAVDATLIRLLVAPALLRLAWRWNWWPGERRAAATTSMRESPRLAGTPS